MNGAREPRLRSFLSFLLWYLGGVFLLFGLLMVGTLLPGFGPRLASVYGMLAGNLVLVVIVAMRCKVGFLAAVAALVAGFAAMLLYLFILMLIILFIANTKLVDGTALMGGGNPGNPIAAAGGLVIGLALLIHRWVVRRRYLAEKAATTLGVFD
jgi:hypothetical protein